MVVVVMMMTVIIVVQFFIYLRAELKEPRTNDSVSTNTKQQHKQINARTNLNPLRLSAFKHKFLEVYQVTNSIVSSS
jgi:Tfp pilus assembly protein PilO